MVFGTAGQLSRSASSKVGWLYAIDVFRIQAMPHTLECRRLLTTRYQDDKQILLPQNQLVSDEKRDRFIQKSEFISNLARSGFRSSHLPIIYWNVEFSGSCPDSPSGKSATPRRKLFGICDSAVHFKGKQPPRILTHLCSCDATAQSGCTRRRVHRQCPETHSVAVPIRVQGER